ISGADGETHQGVFDLSFLNLIPNLTIAVPKDIDEFEAMLISSATFNAPLAIRYPKECFRTFKGEGKKFEFGKWEYLQRGNCNLAIIACGERAISLALSVSDKLKNDGVDVAVINASTVKPLDYNLLNDLHADTVVTIEDNQLIGGFGSAVCAYFSENNNVKVKCFAYEDKFIPHGQSCELMKEFGLDAAAVYAYLKKNAHR
ncbi:MAG: 1-deoxy-D-xylulose-5-phosphate synthase, partial [Clostridia bacterium]|nr:1-deoxy-D-xylulose-5-phosphate synthase [Clostridia bacterium]